MKFKFFGTEIYVSFLFFAVLTVMLAADRTGLVIPTLFAASIHETGHLFAMWASGCAPKSIRLIPASVQVTRPFNCRAKSEIAIALCGPAANAAVFAAFYTNYRLSGSQGSMTFAALNLIICAFNMLPVTGLDGGTVLRELIARKTDIISAERTVNLITLVLASAIFAVGVYFAISERINISIFITAIYLFICCIIKR